MVIVGNYLIGTVLGRGKFGWVSRAKHIQLGLDVAVKHAPWLMGEQCTGGKDHSNCDHAADSSCQASLKHEAKILASISHPAIVSLLDIVNEPPDSFFICLEDLGNTSLTTFVYKKEAYRVEESVATSIFQQLIGGLIHLHNKGILHRDVKPDNIMIMERPKGILMAKLIDLGLSATWDPGNLLNSSSTRAGTLSYMAPELMKPQISYESKVDIFSLGACLYFTLVGDAPFHEFERNKIRSTTAIYGLQVYHDDALSLLSGSVQDLLKGMLQTCPNLRCSLSTAHDHVWFRDYDC